MSSALTDALDDLRDGVSPCSLSRQFRKVDPGSTVDLRSCSLLIYVVAGRGAGIDDRVPEQWVFCDDGHSGATLVRPALERLRDLVAQVPVEVVLVYSPGRLARKYAYQALLIEELAKAGTSVMFVKGPSSDSPQDALPLSRLVAAPARGWRSRAAPTGTSSTIRTRSLARGQEAERRALTGAGRWIPPRPVR